MKDFKISGSQDLENASVEPNPAELWADENEKTENLFGRAFMDKVFGRTRDYTFKCDEAFVAEKTGKSA